MLNIHPSTEVQRVVVAFKRLCVADPHFDAKKAYRQVCAECAIPPDENVLRLTWIGARSFAVDGATPEQVNALMKNALVETVRTETRVGRTR